MKVIRALLFVTILLVGCGTEEDVKVLELDGKATFDQKKADEAKQIVISMKEVVDVKGVNYKDKIYLAPKVKHFDRFRLKEIRKEGHDLVKARYHDATVHLSTDKKVYMELEKLERRLKEKKINEKQFKNKLKKLEEMMKG